MTAATATNTNPLTARQKDILRAFVRLQAEGQCPPTLRELSAAMGLPHATSLYTQLDALIRKGWLTYLPKVARGYRLPGWLAGRAAAELLIAIEDAPTAPGRPKR